MGIEPTIFWFVARRLAIWPRDPFLFVENQRFICYYEVLTLSGGGREVTEGSVTHGDGDWSKERTFQHDCAILKKKYLGDKCFVLKSSHQFLISHIKTEGLLALQLAMELELEGSRCRQWVPEQKAQQGPEGLHYRA